MEGIASEMRNENAAKTIADPVRVRSRFRNGNPPGSCREHACIYSNIATKLLSKTRLPVIFKDNTFYVILNFM